MMISKFRTFHTSKSSHTSRFAPGAPPGIDAIVRDRARVVPGLRTGRAMSGSVVERPSVLSAVRAVEAEDDTSL